MVVDFTPNQIDAIRYKAVDACVVAGPGSGKTTVLVERYWDLVDSRTLEPRQILAITFTEKAAANMKAKLARKFSHDETLTRELESAWVSTIHGFCARLLREHSIAAGIDPRFAVLDARESEDLQLECLNDALDEMIAEHREKGLGLIGMLQLPRRIAADLRSAYDGIRSAGRSIAEVRGMPSPLADVSPQSMSARLRDMVRGWPPNLSPVQKLQHSDLLAWIPVLASLDLGNVETLRQAIKRSPIDLRRVPEQERPPLRELKGDLQLLVAKAVDLPTAPFRSLVFDVLARFEGIYQERKTALGALDFNDLERRSIELLRSDTRVRDRVREQFRQIMLDEFQDINDQQGELIRLIRGEDVFFAVGDVNQSIYGFRHARPEIFRDYRRQIREARKHSSELFDNFRSRSEILRCVEAILGSAEGIETHDLVARAGFRAVSAPSIEVLRVIDEDKEEACVREAHWIAHRILELRGRLPIGSPEQPEAADFRHFAVLCRNGESMKPILDEFDRTRIPYVCGRRQSFLVSREGLDITALLKTIANPRDEVALTTVLRSPLVGIGDEALLRVRLLGRTFTGGLNALAAGEMNGNGSAAGFSLDDASRLTRFIGDLKRWRAELDTVPLDVLIARMLSDSGLSWTPGSLAAANVEAFLHLARTKGTERGLLGFLRELETLETAINTESDLSDEDQGNAVQVMTAHAAKGLEFPVTIIAAMDKGTQRSSAPVTFTPEDGLGLKWADTLNDEGIKDSWAAATADRIRSRENEESNRLLYVAMTRAAEHLILSYSCGKKKPGEWAKKVDEMFRLADRPPSPEAHILEADGFQARVLITDVDPPPDANTMADPGFEVTAQDRAQVFQIPRPVLDEQYETATNATSLATFARCPRRYYLERYIGWNDGRHGRFDAEQVSEGSDLIEENDPEGSAAELGSKVHELLANRPGFYSDTARELAKVFFESDLGRLAAKAARAEREWDFIADLGGTLVRGSIDLWFEENGQVSLVDYKTDDVAAGEVSERAAAYAPQLALYAIALEQALGKRPARAYLHFLRPNRISEIRIDDGLLNNARELIERLREAQNDLRFDLHEGRHCRSCPFFRSLCPAPSALIQ
jgi:ATP-dependent helicase/nuclease subunit A